MRPLSDDERAVLSALTEDFVSATVIKVRSGLPRGERNEKVLEACLGLAQRGLAERAGSGLRSTLRWRKAQGGFAPERERHLHGTRNCEEAP